MSDSPDHRLIGQANKQPEQYHGPAHNRKTGGGPNRLRTGVHPTANSMRRKKKV